MSLIDPVLNFTESAFNVTFFNENCGTNAIKEEPHPGTAQKTEKRSLSATQKSALRTLNGKECSPSELRFALSLDNRASLPKNVLKPLLESAPIEMTIKDKPNSRDQKYCLTSEGVKAIKKD